MSNEKEKIEWFIITAKSSNHPTRSFLAARGTPLYLPVMQNTPRLIGTLSLLMRFGWVKR